jgi:thiamine pyrophosphate-dependent acetolactate synthase large subunit-like protein
MTIYDAWCDRVPILILGGTGPLDATRRRPWIDWIHTANVQGNLVRDFTKWDDQPGSVAAIPESLLRAYRLAVTEPAGPVYVCFDVSLQEQRLAGETPFELPDVSRFRPAAAQAPDPAALRELAEWLVQAELPIALADRVGRSPAAVRALVELAELLAMPVVNLGGRHSFPTPHALDFGIDLLAEADVVLGLDVIDLEGSTRLRPDPVTRAARKLSAEHQRVASISLDELIHRGLTADFQALPAVDLPILADTSLAIPLLLEACRSALDGNARSRIETRRQRLADRQAQQRERQQTYLRQHWDGREISEARLAAEVWQAIAGNQDIVLTAGRPQRMAPGVFQLSGPEQSVAGGGGGAVGAGPGVALGAALALKDSGGSKLPVAILGDGEMLSSIQALWTAAHYRLPSLWVINSNRSYFNDEDHQDRIAQVRGRPPENKWVAMRMEDPEVDFAALARTFGVHGEGPIKDPTEIGPAVRRALEVVKGGGFAVVDVWTQKRSHG